MVFPSDILSDLPSEPDPSPDSPPPSDSGSSDNAGNDQQAPTDNADSGDLAPQEPAPSEDSPPQSDGGNGAPNDGSFGPPSPGEGDTPPTDVAGDQPGQPAPDQQQPAPDQQQPAPDQPQPAPETPITPAVPAAPNTNLPGLQSILDWLHNAIQNVEDQLGQITSGISDSLGSMIESLIPPEVAAITGLASIIGNLVEGLLNNLAPIADVGQMAQDALTGGIPLALQGFIENAWQERGDSISSILEEIVNNEQLPDNIKAPFAAIHSGTSLVEKVLGIFGLAGLLATLGSTLLSGAIKQAQQASAFQWRAEIPTSGDLLAMMERKATTPEEFGTALAKHGFSDDWIINFAKLVKRRLEIDTLQDARNRGLIDDDTWAHHLDELGIDANDGATLDQLRWQVPTYTDLVHFMTRDAFWDSPDSPFGDIVNEFQLNYGEDALPFDKFAQAGVPEDMARFAWRAHWEIPGRHDANEMFFRGQLGDRSEGGDGQNILRRVYRARGIEPRFIEPLINTAFRPIGRIDIRRLVKNGTMDRDSTIESYQQLGYSVDNATLLADLAITLATQESASEREPYRSGLKQRIVTAFINGTLSGDDAQNALITLGYDQDATTQFIEESEVERHAQLAGHIRQGTQRLYTTGEWDKDTTAGYLQSKGFSDTEISRLFEWWEPLRELSDLKIEHKSHKEATRADILTAYRDNIIDSSTANDHLSAIGYNDDDIAIFLRSADYAKAKSDITTEIEGIHAAFTDRQIDQQQAVHELDALNINGDRRNALLRKWTAELDRKLPDLPLAMVEKLATAKLYTFDELTDELARRHFDSDQIDKFRKLWGYEIEVIAERAKTQSQREADAIQRRADADQRRQAAEQRRIEAHTEAEKRQAEAEVRRQLADQRRAESDARRAQRESTAEHDRMVREARGGRLSIGRIRTAYTLGIISSDQAGNLMQAIGLRPETVALELRIIDEQLRAKTLTTAGSSSGQGTSQTAAAITA